MGSYKGRRLLVSALRGDLLEELSALTKLQNKHVTGLVIINFEETSDVRVVEIDHDSHLCKQFLVLIFGKGIFLDFFGCPDDSCVLGLDLADSTKASSSDLLQDCVLFKIALLLHLDKAIPFDLDFFLDNFLFLYLLFLD